MVTIPAGSFVMGLGSKDPAAAPAHRVTLRRSRSGRAR